jgi:putative colanic acid biosynthesis acetyltransferase WcaB
VWLNQFFNNTVFREHILNIYQYLLYMKLSKLIKSDYIACGSISRTFILVLSYRLARYLFLNKKHLIYKILFVVYRVIYRIFINMICGFDVDYRASIGPGLQVYHGQCLVIGRDVVIGENARLRHATTIGNKGNGTAGSPIIGDNVNIGSNSVIIGNFKIGKNVSIGAGSVVVKCIEDNATVAGNPAKIIRSKNENN